ncbi:hypothetical protein TSAR_007522 [Trichomalopsis sarcophagae]|uniref:Uncharacterized protein n=1 Tax=Trichomalopsis sarcophagae TaxID=543379 RepID=A0A232EM29_9HYME|nr:hypothetical protein TSAR_007522 [Trichomalopsis sarcophagae]
MKNGTISPRKIPTQLRSFAYREREEVGEKLDYLAPDIHLQTLESNRLELSNSAYTAERRRTSLGLRKGSCSDFLTSRKHSRRLDRASRVDSGLVLIELAHKVGELLPQLFETSRRGHMYISKDRTIYALLLE